ncbi:OmpA family protein [Polaromonas sp.]|uniref:OmpA family protein n=1 Tax=Polaromonas sp. TaxID=1869339 RepID=UPI003264EAA1
MKVTCVRNIFAAAAVLVSMAPSLLMAQTPTVITDNPSWYIMPSISVIDPDSRFAGSKNFGSLGLRFGKAISPSWDLQLGGTTGRVTNNGIRYEQSALGVDALYLINRSGFRPFLLAGIGAERNKLPTASHTSPYVNLGVGFQLALSDQWFLQTDLRRSRAFQRDNTFGVDRTHSNSLNFGLSYYFDKPVRPQMAQYTPPAPAVAPETSPPPPPPPPPARFERVTLSATELFAFDSAVLAGPQPKLDDIARVLSAGQYNGNITVTGYTDRLGSEAYNQRLSQRRADAVKAYLTGKGVSADRLTAVGRGETNPVVSCNDRQRADLIKCLAPNRRVEVEEIVIERRVN